MRSSPLDICHSIIFPKPYQESRYSSHFIKGCISTGRMAAFGLYLSFSSCTEIHVKVSIPRVLSSFIKKLLTASFYECKLFKIF